MISVDCGTILNGFVGDSAYTFCVGEVAPEVKKLLKAKMCIRDRLRHGQELQ